MTHNVSYLFITSGCSCYGKSALCPTECIGGSEPVTKTHYGIRCKGIPTDQPNYVLREQHYFMKGCENNAPVAAWCDDYVNKHLECGLFPEDDQYICKCRYDGVCVKSGSFVAVCVNDCFFFFFLTQFDLG